MTYDYGINLSLIPYFLRIDYYLALYYPTSKYNLLQERIKIRVKEYSKVSILKCFEVLSNVQRNRLCSDTSCHGTS
jgi:type IV secretory pathway VirB6-like protein